MNDKQIRIFYTNIRSLSKHYNELLLMLQAMSVQGLEYDILALSETWIETEKLKLFPIKNYTAHISARDDGRRSGGVILYVKNDLKIVKSEKIKVLGANVMKIKIDYSSNQSSLGENTELSLYLVYKDCTFSKLRFVESLEQLIQNNSDVEKDAIFLGDMNINLLDDNESADYLNMFMAHGCLSLQNSPTRDTSCLDHVLSNSSTLTVNCKVMDKWITDHAIIDIEIKLPNTYWNNEEKQIQIVNEKKFRAELLKVNWDWVEEIEIEKTHKRR